MNKLFATLILFNFLSLTAHAIENEKSKPEEPTAGNAIQIKLETTRAEPSMGTGLGIVAELKNISSSTVYLAEDKLLLIVPPELQNSFAGVAAWWSVFPTQHTWGAPVNPEGKLQPKQSVTDADGNMLTNPEKFRGRLALPAGSTYRAIWSAGPNIAPDDSMFGFVSNNTRVILSELNFLFFSPGDYKVSVVLQYWLKPDFPERGYFTATDSSKIRVNAPQSVILVGSALGGCVAYAVLPQLRRKRRAKAADISLPRKLVSGLKQVTTIASGILGAMLLSAIVTILLSRLSETQFLIRVSIVDFWGAVAIGFLANLAGAKVFEKLAPAVSANSPDHSSDKETAGI